MNADKKRWVPICFPQGPFTGSVNLLIKGESVVTAEAAKNLIDAVERDENVKQLSTSENNSSGSPDSQGETKVP